MSAPRPARFLKTRLTDAQRDRSWAIIKAQLPSPRRRLVMPAFAAVLVVLAIVILAGRLPRRSAPPILAGATLETGPNEREAMTLADGSRILLGPSSRVRLVSISREDVRLDLERGDIDAEVVHEDGRSFIVAARDIEVHVVGTHFDVTAKEGPDAKVEVSVSRGAVDVTKGSDHSTRRVGAGESWSSIVEPPPPEPAPAPEEPASATVEPAPAPPPSAAYFRLPPRFKTLFAEGHYGEAYAELGPEGVARATKLGRASDLFEVGQAARLDGHPKEAGAALRALVTKYPKDGRAGVAGLELGRLLLNELNEPAAAAEAFEEAMKLAPSDAFREDALARRVQALEAAGDRTACASERKKYQAAYPNGTHSVTVARRCPDL